MVLEMLFTPSLLNKSKNIIINTMLAETLLSVEQEILTEKLWQLKLTIILVQLLLSTEVPNSDKPYFTPSLIYQRDD